MDSCDTQVTPASPHPQPLAASPPFVMDEQSWPLPTLPTPGGRYTPRPPAQNRVKQNE